MGTIMNKDKVINKGKDLFKVLIFSFALIGMIMVAAYCNRRLSGYDALSLVFVEQVICYTGVITIGIVICLTDIVLTKVSGVLRIGSFAAGLYIVSLVYFSQCPINPLQSIIYFMAYTVLFSLVTYLICMSWFYYQRGISDKYGKHLDKFQITMRRPL